MPPSVADVVIVQGQTLARHAERIERLERGQETVRAELSLIHGQTLAELGGVASRVSAIDKSLALVVKEYDDRKAARDVTDGLVKRATMWMQLLAVFAVTLGVLWAVFRFGVREASPPATAPVVLVAR